jgi:hypothetical protein
MSNPSIIDEASAKIIFTKDQIKNAKATDGILKNHDGTVNKEYILNKQTNPVISNNVINKKGQSHGRR